MTKSTPYSDSLRGDIESRDSTPQDAIRRELAPRLTQIEKQISGLKREQQTLYAQWNATLTICRLPPEIILEIFTQYSAENCPGLDDTRVYASAEWTKLRLVFRYWNAVACATPGLWRQIDVYRCSSWLALCLERSRNTTLDVSFFSFEFPLEIVEAMFSLHGHRLRRLEVHFFLYSPWSDIVFKLRAANMHALEDLRLLLNATEDELDTTSNDLNLTHSRLPLLHTLRLRHGVLSDMQVLSNLRVLHMTGGSSSLSIDQFIAALASSWRLEHLTLMDFLEGLIGGASLSTLSCQPSASLSRLTRLEVAARPAPLCAAFLTRLRLPTNASVYISSKIESFADEATYTLPTLLPSAPVLYESLPALRGSLRRVTVNITSRFYEVYAFPSTSDRLPTFSMSLSFDEERWEDRLHRCVSGLIDVFGQSPLTDLQLGRLCANVDQEYWETLLKSFPDLERITLHGKTTVLAFWTALSAGLERRLPGDPDAPSPLCLRLKHIGYQGALLAEDEETLFAAIRRCLVQRAKWGLSLDSLRVFVPSGAMPEFKDTMAEYVLQFHGIVDDVNFKDQIIFF
ncbi:hypothetical protein C2E23DRAFT_847336 [Lenzites betulinus]|nr:hypothetical protein C2E23DRAFT_847336 [Lenzites betulinus]